ncbi:multiple inositol polyphosphate phosphatase 1-like isoform X2 [Coccinella septempunctata]|uniref:multiple inositol polyphosphate phosphatase 1-like isoform X2 n=1 Tax=Coccinella septempunctata TaxID=41139 RepID=UPI001D075B18|nr:multiple inositol polyphosphate phosphatase 1-like isoform X2 [Coccinella septempunctata]
MENKIWLILLYLAICVTYNLGGEICSDNPKAYQNYLGTKTPYRFVGNNTFGRIEYPGCTTKKIWMIVRHGTRNPSHSFIESMNNRLPQIRDLILKHNTISSEVLHNSDLMAFQKWDAKLHKKDSKKLTHEGQNELINIAERMQSRFPSLLSNIYSNTSYKFKFTDSQRTKKSAYYFAVGLFGKNTAKSVWYPEPSKKDPILRFYKLCKKWRNDVKLNPESLSHRTAFGASPLMTKIVTEISDRLKLPKNSLTFDDAYTMYSTCAFETAWKANVKSPWCSAFTINDMKAFEYYEDLKYYWIDGYGYNLNHKQACVAFDDVVSFFNSKSSYPKATVYFTHSGTLLKVMSHFGLYKEDQPLTENNFNDKVDNRTFRVSRIGSFATNLALVLMDCEGTPKILALHQERIVRLPSCPTTTCEFEEICDNGTDETDEENTDDSI